MKIDHIFIFSANKGNEAEDLINFGMAEGSNRVHPGQGTINRKFYFENFYLEILWVHSEEEVKSTLTSHTQLWKVSQFIQNGNSPYGLCLVKNNATDDLFGSVASI